jgi:hypothetical protein
MTSCNFGHVIVSAFITLVLSSATLQADPASKPSAAPVVQLATGGKAMLPIVVGDRASARVRAAAATLGTYLGRIAGATFEVRNGDGASAIAVGSAADFPRAAAGGDWPVAKEPTQREDYLLRSHDGGIYLVGATDLAVEHAVWDFLYRLGYRQFFPGPKWEVVPHTPDLSIAVDAQEHPDYYARRIWYGFGKSDYNEGPYADWCARNRATSGIQLSTGHSYQGIIRANKAAFAAHPEYLGLVNGKRTSTKFCISNPGLRKLVADYAVREFAADPSRDSISMDPSDGGGWCECEECAKLGSITDRALLLANEVAAAVNAKYPGKFVGMYAYNYHSPPPNIKADPHVVVSVATAFLKGGTTLEENLAGWASKASLLGIREYYSVNTWDRDLPGAARGGNIGYLQRTIPQFSAKQARFMSAESSDNWGPNGLGYYLASRMLWDVREAGRVNELREDFLEKAFGPAREPMREYYKRLDGAEPHLVACDQLGRMFRSLQEARTLAANVPDVLARIDDLTLYAEYVDLFEHYSKAQGPQRQAAFETLIRHAYRMRKTMLVHDKALYRDLSGRDKSVTVPAAATWRMPEGKNPWKSSAPFTADELSRFIAEGIDHNPLSDAQFKPIVFGEDLVDPAKLNPPAIAPADIGDWGAGRGRQTFYTRVETAPAQIALRITGGLIAHYRDRGNVKVVLWKIGGPSQTGERETMAAEDHSTPPDGNEHAIKLTANEPGLYRLTIDDGNDRTLVKWDCKFPATIKSSGDEPMNGKYTDLWKLYFYVPKGTTTIGFFGGEHGEIRDSHGRPVFWLNGRDPNYYSAPVPEGEDGRFWLVRFGRGPVRLLTVPPYFARTPSELLLPSDVVNAKP